MSGLKLILFEVIIILLFIILTSFLFTIFRRAINQRRQEKLDNLRDRFMTEVKSVMDSGSTDAVSEYVRASRIRVGSLDWMALEDTLLQLNEGENDPFYARNLIDALGYTKIYHLHLMSTRSTIKLCNAAEKLGRIRDTTAVERLSELLKHDEPEVATVAFRALCRIGTNEALGSVLPFIPTLLKDKRMAAKSIQTSLSLLGPWAEDPLLDCADKTDDSEILALILETLTVSPTGQATFDFALQKISHPDPQVRVNALKILAGEGSDVRLCDSRLFLPLMNDPVWFVRLHATKAISKLKCENYQEMLKKFSIDEHWQVRDAATLFLIEAKDMALDAFLALFESPDRFAKESLSEGIQRTGFVLKLIEYLGSDDLEKQTKAKRILTGMHKVGFSTPMREAAEAGTNGPGVTAELNEILLSGGAA